MTQPPKPSNPTLVSEEHSQKELAATEVSRGTAKGLAVAFCALLAVPVAVQLAVGGRMADGGGLAFPPTRETLAALGRSVDESSVLKRWVQPRLQEWLTGAGGFGNEKVALGRDGWLYYAPGLRYVTGQSFLDPEYLRAKAKAMVDKEGLEAANPDPRLAFRQLAEDCRRLGIRLVLVPVPDKGMLVREPLGGRADGAVPQNPGFAEFRAAVEGFGAEVVAVEEMAGREEAPWYLQQDTHWTPRFMSRVAKGVAERLGRAEGPAKYRLVTKSVSSTGDLVAMLKLPEGQRLYGPESVEVAAVEPVGEVSGGAEVLLLGDSFTNIYSSPSLAWGERAGFGEHLSYYLNAPVDTIALNGGGATVRQELVRAARSGRLAGTRTLVYEFAIRDLYLEDWPPMALGDVPRTPARPKPVRDPIPEVTKLPRPGEVVVSGTIVQMSKPMDPDSAPYDDGLIFGKLKIDRVESGSYEPKEAIVVFLAMRKRVLQPGARHKPGDRLRLRLVDLKKAPAAIQAMQRSDDTEDYELVPQFVWEELR